MALTDRNTIQCRIDKMRTGYIFTSSDFYDCVNSPVVVSRILGELVREGRIRRVGKGKFDKPKHSAFGTMPPSLDWLLRGYLMDGKKTIGYITGVQAYAQLGLTTQISSTISIGCNTYRRAVQRAGYTVRFVLQPNTITRKNIPLLQILDAIRFIKQIPACTAEEACRILRQKVASLPAEDRHLLASLSMAYTGSVRALAGAILDETDTDTQRLYNSLNPATVYKLGLSESVLPNAKKWRIG